jgi:hypothetical protein
MQTTPGSSRRLNRFCRGGTAERAWAAAIKIADGDNELVVLVQNRGTARINHDARCVRAARHVNVMARNYVPTSDHAHFLDELNIT